MATSSKPCGICLNSFSDTDHKAVTLPCDHSFCLTCLVQLKSSGSQNCSVCHQDWSCLEIQILPRIETLRNIITTGLAEKKGEKSNTFNKPSSEVSVMCKEHSCPCLFWCDPCNQFICKKCILDEHMTCLCSFIEDAIPSITASICVTANCTIYDLQGEADYMQTLHGRATKALSSLTKLKDAIVKEEAELNAYIQSSEAMFAQKIQDIIAVEEAMVKSEQINTACDIELMQECQQIVMKCPNNFAPLSREVSQSLLCDIASSYMDKGVQCLLEGQAKMATFMRNVHEYGRSSILEEVEDPLAAECLKDGKPWIVDNKNCQRALYALATKRPSAITLLAREDCPEPLPVADFAERVNDCEVKTRYLDSFYCPQHYVTDVERLDYILDNDSLTLVEFYGHLDGPGLARLPQSITELGLAIGSAADAKAVNSLAVWDRMSHLHIAVSSTVAPEDLLLLPSVAFTWLYFYGLTDTRVDNVRPAIEALLSDKRRYCLIFPSSYLTAAGARRLAGLLYDDEIDWVRLDALSIAPRDRPSVEAAFDEAGVYVDEWKVAYMFE